MEEIQEIQNRIVREIKKLGQTRMDEIQEAIKNSSLDKEEKYKLVEVLNGDKLNLEDTQLKLTLIQSLTDYKKYISWTSSTTSKAVPTVSVVAAELFKNEKGGIIRKKIKEVGKSKYLSGAEHLSPRDLAKYGPLKSNTFKYQLRGEGAYDEKKKQLHEKEVTIKRAKQTALKGRKVTDVKNIIFKQSKIDILYDPKYVGIPMDRKLTAFNKVYNTTNVKLEDKIGCDRFIVRYNKCLKI